MSNDDKFYDFIAESKVDRAVINEKLDTIINHTKETNGRVHKLELAQTNLKEKIKDTEVYFHNELRQHSTRLKAWVWRSLVIVTLLGSFVWIKESRDTIIDILKIFV